MGWCWLKSPGLKGDHKGRTKWSYQHINIFSSQKKHWECLGMPSANFGFGIFYAVEHRGWIFVWQGSSWRKSRGNGGAPFSLLKLDGGTSNIVYVHPYLGKWSSLTIVFPTGWNKPTSKTFELIRVSSVEEKRFLDPNGFGWIFTCSYLQGCCWSAKFATRGQDSWGKMNSSSQVILCTPDYSLEVKVTTIKKKSPLESIDEINPYFKIMEVFSFKGVFYFYPSTIFARLN